MIQWFAKAGHNMPIKVLLPEVVSQIAAGEMVENGLDSLTPSEAITKLCQLKQEASEVD